MRLQKFLSNSGIASRRKSEELISEGRVAVNGTVISEKGVKVSEKDIVSVDGKIVSLTSYKLYIIFNKPVGVITTVSDDRGRKTVMDFFKGIDERIFPVGRLDKDTSGLLLLTNDGLLTERLTHPSFGIEKTYLVDCKGSLSREDMMSIREGIFIDGKKTSKAKLKKIADEKYEITLHEGRNREVRKLFSAVGHNVVSLKRIRYDFLNLNGLPAGKWRFLKKEEAEGLKKSCKLL